ncbi:MAG TPA: hypothetical protein VKZ79_00030 [Alphaproteobacteria bacterium]|nr:hypothetical protein [Alphaproteobacteria bacterium]
MRTISLGVPIIGASLIAVAILACPVAWAGDEDHNSIAIGGDPTSKPARAVRTKTAAIPPVAPKPAPKSRGGVITIGSRAAKQAPTPIVRAPMPSAWSVSGSLKSTLRDWAVRANWPEPQFLTESDWPVDVPGAIAGTIEAAIKALPQGFSRASSRPRIEVTANNVILVTESNP